MDDTGLIYFNGVNATRGQYAREPMSFEQLAALIRGNQPGPASIEPDREQLTLLKHRAAGPGSFATAEGVRQDDLSSAGWGVIFPAAGDYAAVREALTPLLQLRRAQAGALFRDCFGATGYQQGETARAFLRRQGAATSGPVDPTRFPYYLLLVGSPEEIPFRFQYQLGVQYAVGRLHLPTLEAYGSYARSVVAAEQGEVTVPRRAVFFAPTNPDDPATTTSARDLVAPLHSALTAEERARGWQLETVIGEPASKGRLARLLGGPETPALIFTASHGAEFDPLDPRLVDHQGAILCQDWPGPRAWAHRALKPDFYMAGTDIGSDARLLGSVAFHFACFGAGTPRLDDFAHLRGVRETIAPHAFVAGLPQRLLGHPRGGALAVVGHVERAWTYSFNDSYGSRQIETFTSFLRRVMLAGAPVGWALEFFAQRYAELAAGLTEDMENLRFGVAVDERQLVARWTEHNDARSYLLLGDPAVRLPLPRDGAAAEAERATIPEVPSVTSASPEASAQSTPPPAQPASQPAQPAPQPAQPAPQPAYAAAQPQPAPYHAPASPPPPWGAPPPVVIYYTYAPPSTPQPTAAQPPPGLPPEGASAFGIREWVTGAGEAASGTVSKLTQAMQEFAEKLTQTLQATLQEASDLKVSTYVATNPGELDHQNIDLSKASLAAYTRMRLDGDTEILVPMSDMGIDQDLWQIHTAMVAQAQAHRAEMIKAIAQVATSLVGAVPSK